jgi:RNA polymerase sigma factor (sigma-70 family)
MALGIRKAQANPAGVVPTVVGALTRAFRWQPPIDEEFEEAYVRLFKPLVNYIRRLVGTETAKDVVGEVFLKLFLEWHQRTPDQRSDAVIATMARQRAQDVRKRQRRGKEVIEEYQERHPVAPPIQPDAEAELKELHDVIVDALPERCAEVYLFVKENESSYKEAADHFRIRVSTVKSHVKKGNAAARAAAIKAGYGPTASTPPTSVPAGRNTHPSATVPPTKQSDEKGRAR